MCKKTRKVKLVDSIGEISASLLVPFPPGVPVLATGERVTEVVVAVLAVDIEIAGS